MLVIGELINTSRKKIHPAVEVRDAVYIQDIARRQVEAGAQMVDVNAGTLIHEEPEALRWLVQTVQTAVDVPLCIDSPNPVAIESALEVHRGKALVNSISDEKERFERIAPVVKKYGCGVVGLCMDDTGIPRSPEGRFRVASNLVCRLLDYGIAREDIYLDALIQPVSVVPDAGTVVLETLGQIKANFNGIHTICGLSNFSYGLPRRAIINQAFLVMAISRGLDAAIVDPLDSQLLSLMYAAEAALGKDEFCLNYIRAFSEGKVASD